MRFPTKAKCKEWLATFEPHETVGSRSSPMDCPIARLIRSVIGEMLVRISVVPPKVRLYAANKAEENDPERLVSEAYIPLWARCIIVGVDANLPPNGSMRVTAGEVSALLK